ncbi:MAG: hypothetical protein IPN96_18770 [Anaerolineales bacterium]|nr:hypothetical protein [Anaerolineales bacterium]
MRAFHGRTYGSLSATYNKKYREGFGTFCQAFRMLHITISKLWRKP